MSITKRLGLAVAAATLALPAGALAAGSSSQSGVVLSVQHHTIQVINPAHAVSAYRYHGRRAGLHPGSEITFATKGDSIGHVRVTGSTRSFEYYASVVRSGKGHVVLKLADGRTVRLAPVHIFNNNGYKGGGGNARAADAQNGSGGISLTVNAPAGTTVLVSETLNADGSVSITITIEGSSSGSGSGGSSGGSGGPGGSGGSGGSGGELSTSGIVTEDLSTSFQLLTTDGTDSTLTFEPSPTLPADLGLSVCDTVVVFYHQDSSGDNIVDSVTGTGTSDAGYCDSDSSYYPTQDETGPITALSSTSITIDTSDQGSMTFPLDPAASLSAGFAIGDLVDVTYTEDPSDNVYVSDVEYVENDSTGFVTSVSLTSLTITDDTTGQSDVFSAPASARAFFGIRLGEHVDVTWHTAAGGAMVVDNVSRVDGWGGGGGGDRQPATRRAARTAH